MKSIIIILILVFSTAQCAKILGIFHHPGKSHHKLGEVLLKALAKKGHEVTMVSPYPLKKPIPNYRDIFTYETLQDMNERIENQWFQKFSANSASIKTFNMLINMTTTQAELLFQNEEFKTLMQSGDKYDVIIMDWMFNESHLVFGKIFNCPIIPIASAGTSFNSNYLVGNSAPVQYVPFKFFPLTDRMNFWQRVLNVAINLSSQFLTWYDKSTHQKIINKYIENAPKLDSLYDKVALVLSNGHYSFETNRPAVPNLIEVGGFHVEDPKPLSDDINSFVNKSPKGFIYFSMGSNMKSIFLDESKQKAILNAFAQLPVNVLWKYEGKIPNLPKNVKILKWVPQNDILAHPNILMFITHGGLLSTIESVHYGVPMIGIPMFGDQNSNVPTGVEAGYALQIKPDELSEQKLFETITRILANPKYKIKAKLHSKLLRNQPVKPLDLAIYWVEHVIEHKGADHLRNGSMRLTWYQNMLLDVILFIIGIIIVALVIIYYLLIIIFIGVKKCTTKKKENKKTTLIGSKKKQL